MREVTLTVLSENGVVRTYSRIFTVANIQSVGTVHNGTFAGKTSFRYLEAGVLNSFIVNESEATVDAEVAEVGKWGYASGVSGTVTLTGKKKVKIITAVALGGAGSFTINSGDPVQLPYDAASLTSSEVTIEPVDLIDPTIVFTNTDSYLVEYVGV